MLDFNALLRTKDFDLNELQVQKTNAVFDGGELPYGDAVNDLFVDGVTLEYVKDWHFSEDNHVVLLKGTSPQGDAFVAKYEVCEPEYSDEDWVCSGTLTIDGGDAKELAERLAKIIHEEDTALIKERMEALFAAVTQSEGLAAMKAASAFAKMVCAADLTSDESKRNMVEFRENLLNGLRERSTPIDQAEAGLVVLDLLRRNPEAIAITINASTEYEYDDSGRYFVSPNYFVSMDTREETHEDADGMVDDLYTAELCEMLFSGNECGEATFRVERKALAELLQQQAASGQEAWKIIQATTQKWVKTNEQAKAA